jgi:hypothetical protein
MFRFGHSPTADRFTLPFYRGISLVVWCVISVLDAVTNQHPDGAFASREVRQGSIGEASDEVYSADKQVVCRRYYPWPNSPSPPGGADVFGVTAN